MKIRKSDNFISDVEGQYEWYVINAGWEVAEHYLSAVEITCRLLEQHPLIGPMVGFSHPKLREWRFIVVFRPFQKHVLFYEIEDGHPVLRRALHGHRDLPRRLLEPPQ